MKNFDPGSSRGIGAGHAQGLALLVGTIFAVIWTPVLGVAWVAGTLEVGRLFSWSLARAGLPLVFIGGGAASGLLCRKWFEGEGRKEWYKGKVAARMRELLWAVPSVLCVACFVVGIFECVVPAPIPLLPFATILLIAFFGIAVPIDATAVLSRRKAIRYSVLLPWAFCAVYPLYMFERPATDRWYAYWAVGSVAFLLIGWFFWACSAATRGYV